MNSKIAKMTFYIENPPHIDIQIWVKPGSSREEICRPTEQGLVVCVHAKPQDGQANEAVKSIVAKWLKIPKSRIILLKGEKSRQKWLRIPYQQDFLEKFKLQTSRTHQSGIK